MSRVCFSKGRGARIALCLAGAAGMLAGVVNASGQETGLRGAVAESEVNTAILPGESGATDPMPTGTTGIPASPYEPTSPGALGENDTLFPDPASGQDDTFRSRNAADPIRPTAAEERENRRDADETAEDGEASDTEAEALDDLTTGMIRTPAVGLQDTQTPSGRLNERAQAIEGRARRREDNPYAPLGLRLGTFVLFPTLEQGLTWTSNADNVPDGEEAFLSETTLRLDAVSDWSTHQARLSAYGTFRKSLSGEEVSEPEAGADVEVEIDISNSLRGRATLGYSVERESAASPVVIAGVEDQPLRHAIDASLGLEKSLGRLRLGITGEVSRNQYGDAELVGGGTLSQSDRNATLALMRLRTGYELSPALVPFIEVEAGRRIYDEERDSAGYERSALRLGARTGVELDLSEKLSGEISAGWISEDYEDSRLETISGLALAASLDWSPRRGTLIGLDASTTVEGSTDAGESGSLLHSAELRLERQMRANLTGAVALGASYRDYSDGGHDLILSGEAALTWWLNRYAGLTGRLRHERQTSSLPGRDYETSSVFMGVRLQR